MFQGFRFFGLGGVVRGWFKVVSGCLGLFGVWGCGSFWVVWVCLMSFFRWHWVVLGRVGLFEVFFFW